MTKTSDPLPQASLPSPPVRFRWSLFVAGLLVSLIGGWFLTIFTGFAGMLAGTKPLAFLFGVIPGALCMLTFRTAPRNGFSHGMLIGGAVVALMGGTCSASMVGKSFH